MNTIVDELLQLYYKPIIESIISLLQLFLIYIHAILNSTLGKMKKIKGMANSAPKMPARIYCIPRLLKCRANIGLVIVTKNMVACWFGTMHPFYGFHPSIASNLFQVVKLMTTHACISPITEVSQ